MKRTKLRILTDDVGRRLQRLQQSFLDRTNPAANAWATAALATLRTCDPLDPSAQPKAWPITIDGTPPELEGIGDSPSRAESTRHMVLVLYAKHQQGQSRPMHVPGLPFAAAVRRLINERDAGELGGPIRRRFDQVILASTHAGRAEHLRSLVSLLRSEDIGLDYVRLTRDLFRLADPRTAAGVRLSWARQLYQRLPEASDSAQPNGDQS